MDTNKMRAEIEKQFEQFFVEYEKKRDSNGWLPLEAHVLVHMRNAWIASREAVVVELRTDDFPMFEYMEFDRKIGFKEGLGFSASKIEAQGLKVAP